MSTYATYSDTNDYISNASMRVETTTLIGMSTTLAAPATLGATTLQVASTSGAPASPATYQCYLLDGLNSETVIASTTDGTHLAVPAGTLAAHGAGVSVSTAGTGGCLADAILAASRLVESICRQGGDGAVDRSLFAVSRTERLRGPSIRAAFDRDGALDLKPYHFPIQSVTSVTVQMGAIPASTIDLTYQQLPDGARTLWLPQPQVQGASPAITSQLGWWWPRAADFVATLVYTGGPIAGATLASVPDDIRKATHFLISDLLGYRQNPTGAAEVRRGDFSISARLRGDTSGNSILMIQARSLLQPYMVMAGM